MISDPCLRMRVQCTFRDEMLHFRKEVNERFDRLDQRMDQAETTAHINKDLLLTETHKNEVNDKFRELKDEKRNERLLLKVIEADLNNTMERVDQLEEQVNQPQ